MLTVEEDMLRDLMQRATEDLHAPVIPSAHIRMRARKPHRRLATITAVAAAAAVVAALSIGAAVTGSSHPAAHLAGQPPAQAPTASRTVLYDLASVSLTAPPSEGRYAVLSEKQNDYSKTSVIDSVTGDIWTYQEGNGVPTELPVAHHGSPTEAQFAAMPTDPPALRATLIAQAQQARAEGAGRNAPAVAERGTPAFQPDDDDEVFEQATQVLWNPLVPPSLRSALYKVLSATPGVQVDANAHDAAGRDAVKISRTSSSGGYTTATFENPSTGAVLETLFESPFNQSTDQTAPDGIDLYDTTTWTNSLPANPYSS